jgi:hypothetical protein
MEYIQNFDSYIIPHFLNSRFKYGGKVVSLARWAFLPPPPTRKIPGTHFWQKPESYSHRAIESLEGLGKSEKEIK